MTLSTRSPLTALINRLLPGMRYPYLFLILAALFLVDLVLPDPIPLIDEVMLAVLTFIAATFTTRREPNQTPRDITPVEDGGAITAGGDSPPETEGSDLPP